MKRNAGKKVAFGFAMLSVIGAIVSLVFFGLSFAERGSDDPITASLAATIFFFVSCTVVLYIMSKPPRHELQPWDSD